jgi:hypothetical protein
LQHCGALAALIPELAAAMGEAEPHRDAADSVPVAALKRLTPVEPGAASRLAAVLLGCVATPADADRLGRRLRADRETTQLLRSAVAGWALWPRAETGDADALYDLARLWKGLDGRRDIDAPVAVCAAQAPGSRVPGYLKVALPAARRVSAAGLDGPVRQGAALGRALADARRAAMRGALRDAGLVT